MIDIIEMEEKASKILGFNLSEVEQGTKQWHISRAGVITASRSSMLLMKRDSLGRMSYLDELVASVATATVKDEIKAYALQWGKDHEDDARDAYSARTFETVIEIPFIYKDESMRAGCSPDGLILGENKGLELKCPFSSSVYVSFAGRGYIKKEEVAQVQFTLWVTGAESWAFAKYDPRMVNCKKLHNVIVERDEAAIKKLEDGYLMMVEDMDKSLNNLGMKYGQQWDGK